jgi:DNA-binding FadR family transcriptional regulator
MQRQLKNQNLKLSEKVARSIAHDITRMGLAAGTRLPPEADMLDHYGIGRPTLREALRILEVQGLIVLKLGQAGGPIVTDPTPEDFARVASLHLQARGVTFQHLLDFRRILEPAAAAAAARDHDDDGLRALERSLGEDLARRRKVDLASRGEVGSFHRCVAELGNNPVLAVFTISCDVLCVRVRDYTDAQLARLHEQHREIAGRIAARDSLGAHDAMAAHILDFRAIALEGQEHRLNETIEWMI